MRYFHDVPISLDRFRVLDVLLRTRSPTAAARQLGVTPSAVSKVLAEFRVEMRDALLVRRGDRMIPTPRAERLAKPLGAAVGALLRVAEGEPAAAQPRSVTIAMRDQFAVGLAPALVSRLTAHGAVTELRVAPYDRDRVAEELVRGAIDLAVAVDPPDTAGLVARELYRDSFVCLAPRKAPPTLADYVAARHVATTAHVGYAGIDAALEARGHARNVVARVHFFAAALHLAAACGLYATVPRALASALRPRGLFMHPVPFSIPGFSVVMMWDRRCDRDETSQWLRRLTLEAARSAPATR
jgi:DNA-binding transcriptional LysR family regulator